MASDISGLITWLKADAYTNSITALRDCSIQRASDGCYVMLDGDLRSLSPVNEWLSDKHAKGHASSTQYNAAALLRPLLEHLARLGINPFTVQTATLAQIVTELIGN